MRLLAVIVICFFFLPLHPSNASQGSKPVEIVIAVPSDSGSRTTVTSEQAISTIKYIVGEPTDAPCLQTWNPYDHSTYGCSIEGWFRHELGEVFDYNISVIPIGDFGNNVGDACGSYGGIAAWQYATYYLKKEGVSFARGARTMILLMGGGGWAGHFAPTNKQVEHAGMVGDWGVMLDHDLPNGCIPDWVTPSGGFSHELVGMMGMYIDGGCYDGTGGCYVGDPMTEVEKNALLKYSGQWLRNP